jgi:hypothetical protein
MIREGYPPQSRHLQNPHQAYRQGKGFNTLLPTRPHASNAQDKQQHSSRLLLITSLSTTTEQIRAVVRANDTPTYVPMSFTDAG